MTSSRFLEISFRDTNEQILEATSLQSNAPIPFATTPVFWVPVVSAQHLSTGNGVKDIIDLSLDVSELDVAPIPGDTIGIFPKNPASTVVQLFERLCIMKDADKICQISVIKNSAKKNASVPSFIPQESTLRHIFERCIDLKSVPKKLFLKSLLEYTHDPADQSFLQKLSVRESDTYSAWIASGEASIIRVLEQCPSCNPPVSLLLEQLPRLLPRPYSISYFSGKKQQLHVLFSVLKPDGMKHKSVGICTGWLKEVTKPFHSLIGDIVEDIKNMSLADKPCNEIKIPIFFRKSNGFTHPEDPSRPLIMIGPGTGVAPFLGFLQERQKLVDKFGKSGVGESWLFFGCRYSNRDNIFQKEILEFQKQGVLTKYAVSFSREGGELKYVQDNIRKFGLEICQIMLEKNGVVYICGDSSSMGKDVKECIRDEITKMKGVSKEEGNEILKSLVLKKQYIEDLWS